MMMPLRSLPAHCISRTHQWNLRRHAVKRSNGIDLFCGHSAHTRITKEDPTRQRRYNVGVFGAGRIASSVHLQNILKNRRLNLKWIVDDFPSSVSHCQDSLHMYDIPFYKSDDHQLLLADKSLDAVFVFTPVDTHAHYIKESLRKGKSVMTEKPCCETYDQIKSCYETAEKENKILLTGLNRRFDDTFSDLLQATQTGSLGDIRFIRSTSRDSPRPSYEYLRNTDMTGCSIISDMAIHDIDMAVCLTSGERPHSIYSMAHIHDPIMKEIGQPDSIVILVKYESGVIVVIEIDRESPYGYDMRLEVFGSSGMAIADNPRVSSSIISKEDGASMNQLCYSFPERFAAAYEKEIEHFIACLDGKETPLVKKEECLLTAEIIEKGVESYQSGQVVYFG